jgi:hypothetical protein
MIARGVVRGDGGSDGLLSNWYSVFNPTNHWYEISISGEKYYFLSYATVVTPSFGTGEDGFCTTGSVSDKLLVECHNHTGQSVTPKSFAFATFKKPDVTEAKDALAFGVVSGAGGKESGTANWTSSFDSTNKRYEVSVIGEKYDYRSYATAVTPSLGSGEDGFCSSASVDDKLLVQCYDHNGNPITPKSFAFLGFHTPASMGSGPLAFGVVSGQGDKDSGTANWSSTFNSNNQWYEIAISGESYYFLSYVTVVTPSFGAGENGSCTSGSVGDKLLVQCYDHTGKAVKPASFSFITYKAH